MSDDGMTDEQKNRFDAYIKLADYWADSYERRRQVEWKVSLGLWAVLLGGIVSNDKIHRMTWPWFALYSVVVWLVYFFLWLVPNLRKNERDKRLSYFFFNKASGGELSESLRNGGPLLNEVIVNEQAFSNPGTTSRLSLTRAYSAFFHALTTALLLFALTYILSQPVPTPGK